MDRAGRRRTSRREEERREKERGRTTAGGKGKMEKDRPREGLRFFFFFFFRVSLLVEALGVGSRAQQSGGPIRAGPRGHPGPPFPSPTLYAPPDPPSSPPPITFSYFSLRTPSATPPPSQRGISHNAVFLLLLLLSPRPPPPPADVRCSLFSLNDRRYDAARLFFKFSVRENAPRCDRLRGGFDSSCRGLFGELGERQVRFPRR